LYGYRHCNMYSIESRTFTDHDRTWSPASRTGNRCVARKAKVLRTPSIYTDIHRNQKARDALCIAGLLFLLNVGTICSHGDDSRTHPSANGQGLFLGSPKTPAVHALWSSRDRDAMGEAEPAGRGELRGSPSHVLSLLSITSSLQPPS
jgi:hypothetical protein